MLPRNTREWSGYLRSFRFDNKRSRNTFFSSTKSTAYKFFEAMHCNVLAPQKQWTARRNPSKRRFAEWKTFRRPVCSTVHVDDQKVSAEFPHQGNPNRDLSLPSIAVKFQLFFEASH